jgi:hypothetical protein
VPKPKSKIQTAEVHRGCGGTVRLVHEVWRCDRCGAAPVPITDVLREPREPLCFIVAMHPTKDAPFHPPRALLHVVLAESGRTVECEGWVAVTSDAHLKRLVKTAEGFPARFAERAKRKMAKEQPWRQMVIVDAPARKP